MSCSSRNDDLPRSGCRWRWETSSPEAARSFSSAIGFGGSGTPASLLTNPEVQSKQIRLLWVSSGDKDTLLNLLSQKLFREN